LDDLKNFSKQLNFLKDDEKKTDKKKNEDLKLT